MEINLVVWLLQLVDPLHRGYVKDNYAHRYLRFIIFY